MFDLGGGIKEQAIQEWQCMVNNKWLVMQVHEQQLHASQLILCLQVTLIM